MESSAAITARLHSTTNYLVSPSRTASSSSLLLPSFNDNRHFPLFSIKLKKQSNLASCDVQVSSPPVALNATLLETNSATTEELADVDWDNLGFGFMPTDYMYVMKCSRGGSFTKGELQRFGSIELSPSAGVLNYGQGLFEGLKAYRKEDGNILLFRPSENALCLQMGAERMCMPAPSVEQFLEAIKAIVLANKRWIPPQGKGSLYIRPLLMSSGSVLGIAPAPEFTFLIYVSPVGNYFKEGLAPINLVIETEVHRATPGGVKTIGNYAAVMKAQAEAKAKGYSDIEERDVSVDELLDADEVFCTGTAVVVSPVGSVTYHGNRVTYGDGGIGVLSLQLYYALTSLQMGLTEDTNDWIVEIN